MMCLLANYKKKYEKNICFCILKINEERSWIRIRIRTGSINQRYRYGSEDPVPHQNVTDTQHSLLGWLVFTLHRVEKCFKIANENMEKKPKKGISS